MNGRGCLDTLYLMSVWSPPVPQLFLDGHPSAKVSLLGIAKSNVLLQQWKKKKAKLLLLSSKRQNTCNSMEGLLGIGSVKDLDLKAVTE